MTTLTLLLEDGIRQIAVAKGTLAADALRRAGLRADMPCGGQGRCGKCKVKATGALSSLSQAEGELLTPEEIAGGIRLACCVRVEGDCTITPSESARSQICLSGNMEPIDLRPRFTVCGAAVDIGTTTLAARLYTPDGVLAAKASAMNPQSSWGADVISRIEASLRGQAVPLAECIRSAVDGLLRQMAGQARIAPESIDGLAVTGNTAMLYLLTGISPESLSHAPFQASHLFGESCPASRLGLHSTAPDAVVYLPRCMSAFVGADITTALLASGLCRGDETRLLVDIGTNGEMALWHRGKLYCCSTAAGPAFEGTGLSMGMRGQDGAVDHVRSGILEPHVIGDGLPRGICGSGAVDALAGLLEAGGMDETGLLDADPSPIAPPVVLTQKDVRMIQLAKSAVSAGLRTLLDSVGVSCADVAELAVAGGFGSFLNVTNAGRIGLLPEELISKVRVLGNAALSGAAMLLLDCELARSSEDLAQNAEALTLSGSPIFSEYYMEGMLF